MESGGLKIMKAYVDQESCLGCGICTEISKVFRMNSDRKASALEEFTEERIDEINEAIETCPADAISFSKD